MHPYGPPRKFFRPSGSRGGPRLPSPGAAQDFTIDQDTPPSGFHQSQPYRLPPPPVPLGAPRYRFPPGPRPPFNPYPPPHYGYNPRPPRFGPPPGHWGRGGYGHQGGRGGWRGRGRGFRGRGGRYPYPRHGGDGGSSDDIDAYYNRSMFEDPWKDLLPPGEQSEETTAPPTLSDSTTANQDDDDNKKPEIVASTVNVLADTEATGTDSSQNLESANIHTSGGCIGTAENETDAQSQNSKLAGESGSSPGCAQGERQSTVAIGDAEDTSTKAEDRTDHLCVTNTDQESLQIEESTCTAVQD